MYNIMQTTGDIMPTTNNFKELSMEGFVTIILDGGERADEAMYYLLQHILYQPLRRRYERAQHLLLDGFDDILDDFFFHLRDGSAICSGPDKAGEGTGGDAGNAHPASDNQLSYPSLRRIRNRQAFVQWMLRTFRNYLNVRIDKESPFVRSGIPADSLSASGPSHPYDNSTDNAPGDPYSRSSFNSADFYASSSILTDEQKLSTASNLLAYAHQVLSPREGFILLRSLLTMLDKRQSLPNEEMAEVLGMTNVTYRVTVHRMKERLAQFRARLLQGEPLRLDEAHRQMAQRINEDFLHLYPTLSYYYTQSIGTLDPGHADAVNRLRQAHLAATGDLLHEPAVSYEARYSKAAVWNLVERVIGE